jgi:MFS superfamily sulfate permease-like transporter
VAQVGVFLFTLGLMRFGFLDILLSRPLLAGFINAVALIILLEQVRILLLSSRDPFPTLYTA